MRDSNSLLPTSSVEMKTDRFTSYGNYAKAGFIFAATTATYFLAKTTGMLPNWFWGGETSSHSETIDTALTVPKASSLVIEEIQPEVAVFSTQSESAESSRGFVSGVTEPSLIDFQEADLPSLLLVDSVGEDEASESSMMASHDHSPEEIESEDDIVIDTTLIKAGQRRLLQQSGNSITVQNPIPDQWININQPYSYFLDKVFSKDEFFILTATETGQPSLPNWLSIQYTLEGSYPDPNGAIWGIAVSGDTVFLADNNNGLLILNVSTLSAPQLLSVYNTPSNDINAVAVSDNTVFVTDGTSGLYILDVSTPSMPILLYNYGSSGYFDVVVANNIVFAVGYDLLMMNVSTPSSPLLLGDYNWGASGAGYGYQLAVSGDVVFLAAFNTGTLILNVSRPNMTTLLYNYPALTAGGSLAVSGDLLFVKASSVLILNVSIPGMPQLVGSYSVSFGMTEIFSSGDLIFLTNQMGLSVLDISLPNSPQLIGEYSAATGSALTVSNNLVFAIDSSNNLLIVNFQDSQLIGNPPGPIGKQFSINVSAYGIADTAPAFTQFTLTLDQLPDVKSTVPDQSLLVGNTLSLPINGELLFANPADSFLALSLQLIGAQALPTWLNFGITPTFEDFFAGVVGYGIVASGNTVFVANGAELLIVDVSVPNSPQLMGNYPCDAEYIAISGSTVFVTGSSELLIFDVTNLNSPGLLSSYPASSGGAHRGVAVLDGVAFVAEDYTGLLLILDVSMPNSPRFLSNYATNSSGVYDVAISGSTVYLADSEGILILNVSAPDSPRLIGSYAISSFSEITVAVSGNTLLVSMLQDPIQNLLILNVSIPSSPQLISSYPVGDASGVRGKGDNSQSFNAAISGNTIFVANYLAHMLIMDVTMPGSIQLLGNYFPSGGGVFPSKSNAVRVALSGNTVFMTDQDQGGMYILDVDQWQLTANPQTMTDAGNYPIQLTATDKFGGSAKQSFTIRVEGPPLIHGVIPFKYAKVGQAFNYFVPQGLFTDPNLDVIGFSANRTDGNSLPSWLSFNGIAAIFAGTPQSQDIGNFTVILFAMDNKAGIVNTTFGMLVSHLPVVKQAIPSQVAGIGMLYLYDVPGSTFFSQESYALSYSARQSNGLPLPLWLTFNGTSRQFSGQPNITDAGDYLLDIVANDQYQGQASADFSLIVEHFPAFNSLLTLQAPLAGVGIPFTWEIPSNTFVDQDNDLLTYAARQQDGSLLPNWLSFNPQKLIFSGIPQSTDVRVLPLQLSAEDPSGGQAQQNFNLTVAYFPEAKSTIPTQLADVDQLYQYTVAANTFSQADNAVLLYSAQQSNGLELPDWLHFNTTTRHLSGYPNITMKSRYELGMIVTNPVGAQAWVNFSLIAEYFPEVLQSILPSLADINSAFSFTVPVNSFIDKDGDPLTYVAQRQNGDALPNWLTFNPQSLSFSGVPLETDKGDLPLQIVATDPAGASVTQNVSIQVIHFPTLAHQQPTITIRAGESFNFSLPQDMFTDQDQTGLSYSTKPLPSWLTFDNQTLSFSGKTSSIESTSLTLIATDTRGASTSMSFQLTVRGDVPPATLSSFLSNQEATVGQVFSYFPPAPLFLDAHNNTLMYSAAQQDNSPLPAWLDFNNETLHFSGTPGRGDTNFYATRTVGVKIVAQSDEGQSSASFNVIVGGVSWGQLAVNIGAPLVSLLTTLYALYEYRALLLNRWNRNKYTRLEDKETDTITMGQPFEYQLFDNRGGDPVKSSEVRLIHASIPEKPVACCRFFRADTHPLPGGERLPYWLEYDENKSVLRSKGNVPQDIEYRQLIIQAEGEEGVILEKVTLSIQAQEASLGAEIKKDKIIGNRSKDERKEVEVELAQYTGRKTASTGSAPLISSSTKLPSERELKDPKEESPTSVNKRLKIVPASTPTPKLGSDSPLLQARTTSSVMLGQPERTVGKETNDLQVDRQSRSCC